MDQRGDTDEGITKKLTIAEILATLNVTPREANILGAFLARQDISVESFFNSTQVSGKLKKLASPFIRAWHGKCKMDELKLVWFRDVAKFTPTLVQGGT